MGKQFRHDKGWANLYLGYARNNTELDPDDLANESRGRHGQALISLDGEAEISACTHHINYGASYLFDQHAYWLRMRPICWSYDNNPLGLDLVVHGDKSYRHIQLGGIFYNRVFSENTDYSLKAGMTLTQDSDLLPYIGIELTTRY